MPKTKKKKKGNKKGSAGKKNGGDEIVLTKEQKIQQSICEHIQIIKMMWNLILGPLNEQQQIREKLHKIKCEANNTPYTPKTSIPFHRFQSTIQNMTEMCAKPETKQNAKLNIMLDVFEWFDPNGRGSVSYNEFEQRIGEFFYDENDSKPKKSTRAIKKKKKKKKVKKKNK